ncbi:MAG: hypothetical protein HRF50_02460 [Phycisphaerae bacterium]|jgi:hypothetical protein
MSLRRFVLRQQVLAVLFGSLLVNGCLAAVERGADMVLSAPAASNLLSLPYSSLLPLARFFTKHW